MFSVDAIGGDLSQVGFEPMPAFEPGAREVLVHPDGNLLFVGTSDPISSTNDVALFRIGETTGQLTHLEAASFGEGNHHLGIHPNGDVLYVAAQNTHEIGAFAIDAPTGTITELGDGRPSRPGRWASRCSPADASRSR